MRLPPADYGVEIREVFQLRVLMVS